MKKLVLYIAASLDGYIARGDGGLDWLDSLPNPENIDHGYSEFLQGIGHILMGRKTYQEVLGLGIDWPYSGIETFVVSRNSDFLISSPDTFLVSQDVQPFVEDLKRKAQKDIWLVGGGQLISLFIHLGLLDRMILTFIPAIIGDGIPLFPRHTKETYWTLSGSEAFSTGAVTLFYERKDQA
jgi:dihydrofolate reductase